MAISPRLLNPTKVTFAQKNTATTQYDHLRRTPINIVAKDSQFQIDAQIKWSLSSDLLPVQTQAGTDEVEKGYMILRTKDLTALNKEIKRGDRVVKIEEKTVLFYVLRVEYASHYSGDFKLWKVIFGDREGQDG